MVTFPWPAWNTPNAAQDTISLLCSKDTLLAPVQPGIHQNSQVLFCQAAFQPGGPAHTGAWGFSSPLCIFPCWTSWISYHPMKTISTSCFYFAWSRRNSPETKLGLSVAKNPEMIYFELNRALSKLFFLQGHIEIGLSFTCHYFNSL